MLKHLVDSIMGPDVFITQAISPMFPYQYAHTRFLSTDVYSHLRDDQEGFPHWGSTEASLSAGSHLWWMQGTLFPYTNLDVAVMQRFQQHHELTEQEVKVRIYAMMTMGSILGDGSDFREKVAIERAKKFLDNEDVSRFFSQPKAFTPLRMSEGEGMDQQMSFYLKGDTTMVALFNFTMDTPFMETVYLKDIGLSPGRYVMKEFFSGESLGVISQDSFTLTVPVKDALMVKIIRMAD
jgi:alpha-galactosidase